MPIDNDPIPYEIRQIQNKLILENITRQTVCANCGERIGYESLARTTIKYGDLEFCSEACIEEWLDAIQEKSDEKYYDEGNLI